MSFEPANDLEDAVFGADAEFYHAEWQTLTPTVRSCIGDAVRQAVMQRDFPWGMKNVSPIVESVRVSLGSLQIGSGIAIVHILNGLSLCASCLEIERARWSP